MTVTESESGSQGLRPPDMLIFLSDQHHADYMGFRQHPIVRTPHLDKLAEDGAAATAAYTASPLCVPSRMSMLTGHLPEKTGIYTNNGAIGCDYTTFLHGLAAAGYETVLCGRMHFLGEDQRHGFTKRIMGELTPLFWGRYGRARTDLGPYVGTMANESLKIIGGGNSPVLEYDRAVVRAALDYLQDEHAKPQCLVVGTYGPHHTFVAPPDLYSYYKELADVPPTFGDRLLHPVVAGLIDTRLTKENVLKLRAAYFGMIETVDRQLGEIRQSWDDYLQRSGRRGMFVYVSDHGEQAGEHGLIGKSTFYEGSVKVPMIFAGNGVAKGHQLREPVSLMDIGPTLCDLAGADTPPAQAGISLLPQLAGGAGDASRVICSETMNRAGERLISGRMLRFGNWKYVSYALDKTQDQLFDMRDDPHELRNLIRDEPEQAAYFQDWLRRTWHVSEIAAGQEERMAHHRLLAKWGMAVEVAEPERWKIPEHAKRLPVIE